MKIEGFKDLDKAVKKLTSPEVMIPAAKHLKEVAKKINSIGKFESQK